MVVLGCDSTKFLLQCVRKHNDATLNRLHEKVSKLKNDRRLEGRYMTVEELLKDREQQGMERGLEQGMERGLDRMGRLCHLMKDDNRLEEFLEAAEKPELRERLFAEYGL